MLKIRRPLGRLIFNMGIAIPGKTVFLIEMAPWGKWGLTSDYSPDVGSSHWSVCLHHDAISPRTHCLRYFLTQRGSWFLIWVLYLRLLRDKLLWWNRNMLLHFHQSSTWRRNLLLRYASTARTLLCKIVIDRTFFYIICLYVYILNKYAYVCTFNQRTWHFTGCIIDPW